MVLPAPLRQLAVTADSHPEDSVHPNGCVGVLCPWPPRVLGEALLWVLLLSCRGLKSEPLAF